MTARSELLKTAINAGALIDAVYQYVDRIKVCGGATTISGIAACHAMIESLEKNRHRIEPTILKPLRDAIAAEQDEQRADWDGEYAHNLDIDAQMREPL